MSKQRYKPAVLLDRCTTVCIMLEYITDMYSFSDSRLPVGGGYAVGVSRRWVSETLRRAKARSFIELMVSNVISAIA